MSNFRSFRGNFHTMYEFVGLSFSYKG
jgi:hypothetical protein